ncbi:MAG: FecR family protein [Bacteroidetes bacterium]|nr:FecR family protein [Bacteroidota bacterium]
MKNLTDNQSIHKIADQLVRHYKIAVSPKKEEVLNTILQKIEEKETVAQKHKNRRISIVSLAGISAAASIAIIMALYFFTATVSITSTDNNNLACRLPDNSRIVLQNKSEIKYKKYFWNRKVKLDGIAYFEVEKGNKFQVITNMGSVEVLGTRFLVSEAEDSMLVKCFEGKVKASINKHSDILLPGTFFSGTKTYAQKNVFEETIKYPDFAQFNQAFSKEKLTKITSELEEFFGAEIVVKNGSDRYFSGTIQTGKLESALDIVCESMQLNYKFAEKNRIFITNQKNTK